MNDYRFSLNGADLVALPSGALWWPDQALAVVSDLHLGKSERMARRGGAMLPPYEVRETLERLEAVLDTSCARKVVCLGDTFDDLDAMDNLREDEALWLTRLMAGREWVWIEGNHDPGPTAFGGAHLAEMAMGPLTFRHIAAPDAGPGEVSGHYHPKMRFGAGSHRAFLLDERRVILPAFGTFTGGLRHSDAALAGLMQPPARAILTGKRALAVPLPCGDQADSRASTA
ncbi:metallophosphoesterase [Actibacterium mucosum KCTC 23349]|uniref:Metallophosphoesterase n=1 Tax=Actibacterium mucosum KCTC 23349 TaxID=1454373 RepID=A0A037ZC74_9RHOB|nr:ligase-associated DNA damage response endonuclease PdeM [Actibacterium mucosum]KAJ54094.1 metallophosphoesterase [Actibacterium mucosum KCTC 23349]